MREVHLEIVGYQPQAIEAAIASIGQFPKSMKPRLVAFDSFFRPCDFPLLLPLPFLPSFYGMSVKQQDFIIIIFGSGSSFDVRSKQ